MISMNAPVTKVRSFAVVKSLKTVSYGELLLEKVGKARLGESD